MAKTTIIAEAGVNHNGDLSLALKLVETAAAAGADVVKFQSFRADGLVTRTARKAAYQEVGTSGDESQYEMLRRLEMSEPDHLALLAACRRHRIEFLSTAFDLASLDFLLGIGVPQLKIPSGEITNLPYLRRCGASGKQIILSTGMAGLGEIEAALEALEQAGTARDRITVLHCTTEYPTPMREVNLRAMTALRTAFGVRIGYSDHTEGHEIAVAAVALGASVIEKHFTLDRSLPGPDHKASLEPDELRSMVAAIRNVEEAMGDGIKRPTVGERANLAVARKSIVAARKIAVGEALAADCLTTKRPGIGISPMRWDEVLGRIATRSYEPDEMIE